MKFSALLTEYLERREHGPIEDDGYTDKSYYNRMSWLLNAMDELAPGEVENEE